MSAMLRAAAAAASLMALTFAAPVTAFSLGDVSFKSCDLPMRGAAPIEAQCADVPVPEDPAVPTGRRIDLAVAVLPARAAKADPDAVLFLAGGPGQSAREAYSQVAVALDGLRRTRHVILIDQRGTGGSNRLACPLPDWRDSAEATPAAMREQAERCRDDLDQRADLRRYTTREAVRDLELLRSRLGIAQYNLVGGSYGTRVALEYLRRNPAATRSVVLDGVAQPQLALLQDHARNLDAALALQFETCASTPSCAHRFGPPAELMRRVLDQLQGTSTRVRYADPLSSRMKDEPLGADVLRGLLRLYAYAPESVSLIPLLLHETAQGRPQALMAQADMLSRGLEDQLSHGMELSVVCTEDVPFLKPDSADANTILGGALHELVQAQCAVWPRGEMPADFKQPVKSDKPVLLLSGEFDPVTPPRNAEAVLVHLSNGRHLIARGQGHIVMTRGCAPRLLREFVEGLKPSSLDADCLDVLGPLPAFETHLGAGP